LEPREEDIVRCLVPAAALAAMDTDAAFGQVYPSLVILLQAEFAELLPVHGSGPDWLGTALGVLVGPRRLVVRNLTRKISPAALGDIELLKLGSHLITDPVPVRNHNMRRVGGTNRLNRA